MDLTPSIQHITFPCSFSLFSDAFQDLFTHGKPRSPGDSENGATYTQEVVELLTVPIEKRTAWEHEKLLFSTSSQELSISFLNEAKTCLQKQQCSHQKNLKCSNQQNQKYKCLDQIKTPDLIPQLKNIYLGQFSLEKYKDIAAFTTKKVHCNCKKSKCLKMYCECFRNGEICEGCSCCECGNSDQAAQGRKKARKKVEEKQPVAFVQQFKYKGCRCSKSNCQKGYCQCFSSGLMCGKYCQCRQCQNCSSYMRKKQAKVYQKHKTQPGA